MVAPLLKMYTCTIIFSTLHSTGAGSLSSAGPSSWCRWYLWIWWHFPLIISIVELELSNITVEIREILLIIYLFLFLALKDGMYPLMLPSSRVELFQSLREVGWLVLNDDPP